MIYNRTSKGGNYPTCQSENCNAKFKIGDLTIRTDVFESYPRYDQGKKVNLYFIKAVKYRFCVNPICINQLSQRKRGDSNFTDMVKISLRHVPTDYQKIIEEVFENEEIDIVR